MTSLKGLQRTLRKRLPEINRWRRVSVYSWDSGRLPEDIKQHNPPEGHFYIVWTGPKRKNIHPIEYREIPMRDLELVAERNRMRLRNKTKTHR